MSGDVTPIVPEGKHYIDSSVLMNLMWVAPGGTDARAAKIYLKQVEGGKAIGIISAWTLMEVISVTRALVADLTNAGVMEIERDVEEVLHKIFSMKNVEFLAIESLPGPEWDVDSVSLWEALQEGLEQLRYAKYSIREVGDPPKRKIVGIGGADSLHIFIAANTACDFLATLDRGFLVDRWPINIFDVSQCYKR